MFSEIKKWTSSIITREWHLFLITLIGVCKCGNGSRELVYFIFASTSLFLRSNIRYTTFGVHRTVLNNLFAYCDFIVWLLKVCYTDSAAFPSAVWTGNQKTQLYIMRNAMKTSCTSYVTERRRQVIRTIFDFPGIRLHWVSKQQELFS